MRMLARTTSRTACWRRPRRPSRATSLAELREWIEARNGIMRERLERRNQIHNGAYDNCQAERAIAAARRAAARAAETRAAGVALACTGADELN